jgi:hypothetical protein
MIAPVTPVWADPGTPDPTVAKLGEPQRTAEDWKGPRIVRASLSRSTRIAWEVQALPGMWELARTDHDPVADMQTPVVVDHAVQVHPFNSSAGRSVAQPVCGPHRAPPRGPDSGGDTGRPTSTRVGPGTGGAGREEQGGATFFGSSRGIDMPMHHCTTAPLHHWATARRQVRSETADLTEGRLPNRPTAGPERQDQNDRTRTTGPGCLHDH